MIHATLRAIAYLRDPSVALSAPADVRACTGRITHDGTETTRPIGIIDMMDGVKARPTCPACLVLWDEALERRKVVGGGV